MLGAFSAPRKGGFRKARRCCTAPRDTPGHVIALATERSNPSPDHFQWSTLSQASWLHTHLKSSRSAMISSWINSTDFGNLDRRPSQRESASSSLSKSPFVRKNPYPTGPILVLSTLGHIWALHLTPIVCAKIGRNALTTSKGFNAVLTSITSHLDHSTCQPNEMDLSVKSTVKMFTYIVPAGASTDFGPPIRSFLRAHLEGDSGSLTRNILWNLTRNAVIANTVRSSSPKTSGRASRTESIARSSSSTSSGDETPRYSKYLAKFSSNDQKINPTLDTPPVPPYPK